VVTNVLEELAASLFGVKVSRVRKWHGYIRRLTLKMEVACTSESLVTTYKQVRVEDECGMFLLN
jgi:hypothetical protein